MMVFGAIEARHPPMYSLVFTVLVAVGKEMKTEESS